MSRFRQWVFTFAAFDNSLRVSSLRSKRTRTDGFVWLLLNRNGPLSPQ